MLPICAAAASDSAVRSTSHTRTAPPLRLHGAAYNSAAFNDGQTDGGIREGSSAANTINATFGAWPMQNGILVEVRLNKPAIQIDSIAVPFF